MLSHNLEETREIANEIALNVKNGGLICLFGDLGSGKTAFTKYLAEALGIESFKIKSPTYTYLREHGQIIHIDLYRLEEIDDLLWQEIAEYLEMKNKIIIIEWADRMQDKLPKHRIDIHFKYIDENTREIKIDYL